MRSRKIAINAITGIILQTLTIVYGFIFPRLVMSAYGSGVNGVLQSVAQFLSYISLLDGGVSAVIRAKLYKPLADKDREKIQGYYNSSKTFYKRIALIFLLYSLIVAVFLPFAFSDNYDYYFTFFLIIIIGTSTFAEYFFGISCQVLLEADQRKYIVFIVQSIIVFLNTVLSVVLVKSGFSIHFVKAITALLFTIRPIIILSYCRKRYGFIREYKKREPIENKWVGMAHHFAYFLHTHTDVVLLTIAKGPLVVSVYSVYNMVVSSLRQILTYLTTGIEAAFGNMLAKNEQDSIKKGLALYELLIFSSTACFFSTAAVTILDFVAIYTKGISDVNYIEPVAAIILILAESVYCLRKPYESLVMASGMLKETMKDAFFETFLNISTSLILVPKFAIAGVATGTLIAMCYRTTQYALFVSNNIAKRDMKIFFEKVFMFLFETLVIYTSFHIFPVLIPSNYIQWAIKATVVFVISALWIAFLDFIYFKTDTIILIKMIVGVFDKKTNRKKEKN